MANKEHLSLGETGKRKVRSRRRWRDRFFRIKTFEYKDLLTVGKKKPPAEIIIYQSPAYSGFEDKAA